MVDPVQTVKLPRLNNLWWYVVVWIIYRLRCVGINVRLMGA
jgi:hypothetical protein